MGNRINKLTILIVLAIAVLLTLISFDDQGEMKASSQSAKRSQIGDQLFDVPANYMINHASPNSVWALLPEFSPWSINNKKEFGRLHEPTSREINIFLSDGRSVSWVGDEASLETLMKSGMIARQGEQGPYGLKQYRVKNDPDRFYLFGEREGGRGLLLQCADTPTYVSPQCEWSGLFVEGVWLKYVYKKPFLKDWHSIDKGVRDLIQSFRSR